jgi:restriction endonuclease Mrr
MAIPDFQTAMLPVLDAARASEVRIGEVVERLAADFQLTEDERAHLLPSGRQTTFANRVHWAKSYLGKAGLVQLTGRGGSPLRIGGARCSPPRLSVSTSSLYSSSPSSRPSAVTR